MKSRIIGINQEKCTGCNICVGLCPEKFQIEEGKSYIVDDTYCKDEDLASLNCPSDAIETIDDIVEEEVPEIEIVEEETKDEQKPDII